MHELSISQGIVDICLDHAGGRPINAVIVEIGLLSGLMPEAVELCFAACCAGTLAEDARLEIRQIDGKGRCLDCNTEQTLERLYNPCVHCGSYALEVMSGEEMRVVEIEVAD